MENPELPVMDVLPLIAYYMLLGQLFGLWYMLELDG